MPTIVTKEECRRYSGRRRANQQYNFDNIGQALVVVFVASTADNWQDTMYNGIDTVDVGKNMIYGYNMWNSIYYVIATMLSCFFWANMLPPRWWISTPRRARQRAFSRWKRISRARS